MFKKNSKSHTHTRATSVVFRCQAPIRSDLENPTGRTHPCPVNKQDFYSALKDQVGLCRCNYVVSIKQSMPLGLFFHGIGLHNVSIFKSKQETFKFKENTVSRKKNINFNMRILRGFNDHLFTVKPPSKR